MKAGCEARRGPRGAVRFWRALAPTTGAPASRATHTGMIKRLLFSSAVAVAAAATPAIAQNPAPAPAPAGVGVLKGVVLDSLHDSLLRGALVRVESTNREAFTDSLG